MSQMKITFTDSVRRGTSAKGNAYAFQEGFLHVENKPFPLQCQFYVDSVYPAGDYLVPYSIDVRDARPQLEFNFSAMKKVS